ncbi:Hypothetical predicted protein [Mytilus galloprovincialis]|uniref:Immunoglobulin-like beta-sandwich domain-containing protein n=1 Tax=Mytilus galloprovincialis TaxID=29158 RepID=A0A8B6GTW4_MYTGA|nr:Hypothetical predicted protein [Mytilus galloprovincialis]
MDTVYASMICILFRLWKCDTLFWKKYTTVEIACPFIAIGNESVTWSFEQSTTISIGKVVNPKLKTKYTVTDTRNLQIVNFTYADEGRYTCQGFIGKQVRQDTVIVAVCNVPNKISSLSSVLDGSSSEGKQHQTNVLCTHDTVVKSGYMNNENIGKYLLHATFKLHISPQCNFDNDRGKDKQPNIWNYTCLTLNEDQCVTSNETFQVTVERISKEERSFTEKSTGFLQKQVDVYTGDCVSFNSNCDENIKIYLTNDVHKVLYLNNFHKTTAETLLCHIYKIDILEEITTVDHSDIGYKQLTYSFGGIAVVLIVLLIFAGAVIKTMALKINRISTTDDLPIQIQRKQSIEDEHKNDEDVVPHNVATTDSVNHHSVDLGNCSGGRNSRSNPTLNDNTSSYYQFDVSGNSNTESINEQKTENVNNTDNYFNNCFENDIYSAGDIYVNTNLMNTYEQLEEPPTTDIQTYEDFSYNY